MSIKEWIDAMLGRRPDQLDESKQVLLDRTEYAQAERLSKLTGRKRDEVLAESYRRADQRRKEALRIETESYRSRQ